MREVILNDVTHAALYRAIDYGPRVWPRHYQQFSTAFIDGYWAIVPLDTDEQVQGTMMNGSNLAHRVASFMAAYETRDDRKILRPVFEVVQAYLAHWLHAPCFTQAYDQWLVSQGREPYGLDEIVELHAKNILDVETPKELIDVVEAMMRDGLDALSPVTGQDVIDVAKMHKGG